MGDEMKENQVEDDDRAVDWAPRNIRALRSDLEGTDKAVSYLNDRVSLIENQYSAFVTKTKGRLAKIPVQLDERLIELEEQATRAAQWRTSIEARLAGYGVPEVEFSPPIGGSERRAEAEMEMSPENIHVAFGGRKFEPDGDDELDGIPDVHGRQWQDGRPDATRHGGLFAVGEPSRGVVPPLFECDAPLLSHETIHQGHLPVVPGEDPLRARADEKLYETGYNKGRAAAIEERRLDLVSIPDAERRIRGYMNHHFSEATILGVLNALRGTKPIKDNPQG